MITVVWVSLVISVFMLPFAFYALAKLDLFFTLLESGNIKYIYHGDTLHRIIADVKGKRLEGQKLVKGHAGKPVWGIYWLGLPSIASVKKFNIHKKKEHETTTGIASTEWIKDLGTEEVDSLRAVFPRPFLLTDMELADRQTVTLLIAAKLAVADVYIPVVELKGDFFGNASSTLRAAIGDVLKTLTMDQFLNAPKGEGGILEHLTGSTSAFNLNYLEKQVGLHVMGLSIASWDPSDAKTRDAMNLAFIAEKTREAELIAANTYRDTVGIRNEADALAMERIAKARGAHVKAVLDNLASEGASPNELVKAASKVLRAEAQPNLTSLVEEASAQPVVPVGGGGWK